ncbi:UNVERIFIED_CONTAM: hypothetical protein GTU68_001222 [Idotea baltica]|nr:hypothetical protein [Idotea baltica]
MKVCILIPSYNTGPLLKQTVGDALSVYDDIVVVVDGSTDGSADDLDSLIIGQPSKNLHTIILEENSGKGSAVLAGVNEALRRGFTHAVTMDADGQHPVSHIAQFVELGNRYPEAMILGDPIYDASAPTFRVNGHKFSNWWANLFTLWWGIGDSLFGMRLYPLTPLKSVFESTRWARRFDFDPEVAVRLCWKRVPALNLPTPVKYLTEAEGGVSHFQYWRDNVLLTWMYFRILLEFIVRLPVLLIRSLTAGNPLKQKNLAE